MAFKYKKIRATIDIDINASPINNLSKPDYGDPYPKINKDDIPVFWACGVTPQAVALHSKPKLMITHSPGHMFVTDTSDEEIAVI